jgi:dsRNA-specific ribonuclease
LLLACEARHAIAEKVGAAESSIVASIPPFLLLKALTPARAEENFNSDRLEFVGDAVLRLLVSTALFRLHPGASANQLHLLRAHRVSNRNLANAVNASGLARYLRPFRLSMGALGMQFLPSGMSVPAQRSNIDGSDRIFGEHSLWNKSITLTWQDIDSWNKSMARGPYAACSADEKPLVGSSSAGGGGPQANYQQSKKSKQKAGMEVNALRPSQRYCFTCSVQEKAVADLGESILGAVYLHGCPESVLTAVASLIGGLPPDSDREQGTRSGPVVGLSAEVLPSTHGNVAVSTRSIGEAALKCSGYGSVGLLVAELRGLKGAHVVVDHYADGPAGTQVPRGIIVDATDATGVAPLSDGSGGVRGRGGAPPFICDHFEKALQYSFKKPGLLLQALTIPSNSSKDFCNAQLEFVGDAALEFAICREVIHSPEQFSAKDMSFLKQCACNTKLLAMVGVHSGLHLVVALTGEKQSLKPELEALRPQDIGSIAHAFASDSKRNGGSAGTSLLLSRFLVGAACASAPVTAGSSELVTSAAEQIVASCLKAVIGAMFVDCEFSIDCVVDVVRRLRLMPLAHQQ